MNTDSFGTHDNGTPTVMVNIPENNVPAFTKVITLFELTEYGGPV